MQESDELYLEGIIALRDKNYQEAEDKLSTLLERKIENKKALAILGCLQIRRECQKLLAATKN